MEMTLGSPHACVACAVWSLGCATAANSFEGQGGKEGSFLRCDEEAARGPQQSIVGEKTMSGSGGNFVTV